MKNLILISFLCSSINLFSLNNNENYVATIDLTNVVNDRVKVVIYFPDITNDEIIYCMPKIVPGTYSIYDFGRFISDFTAYNKEGDKMQFEPVDVNQYKIKNATQLGRVEYWVDDTFDSELSNPIFEPGGTNIEDGKNYQINTFGFIGYVEGMKENDYELKIKKPENFYGASPLTAKSSDKYFDTYHLHNYDRLADAPMLYAIADTATKIVGGAEVLIGVYSPNKKISAKQIMQEVSEILEAQEDYLGGDLPVDKYAFLFYFTDTVGVSGGMGALEHMNSSVYFFPEKEIQEIAPFLRDVCAHEFFHIVTPLNIHSEEIGNFNFIEPDMSKHLWLYEGQTEYAAHHAQVKAGLITTDEFLKRMQEKIESSQSYFNDTLAFTDMSEGCLDTYKNEYGNVYEKGALINMCLDIELRRLSNGKYGTQELMKELGKIYGKDRSFKDDELFNKITSLTYPEIRTFFSKYVEGNNALPYEQFLGYAGINLSAPETEKKITLGNISMNYDFTTDDRKITITNLTGSNAFAQDMGYKIGDRLLSINGASITTGDPNETIDNWKASAKAGDKVVMVVERQKENGKTKKVKLKGKAMEIDVAKSRTWTIDIGATEEQIKLRKTWINQ
ncbi:MAG: peptidase M61 [Fimbriimonadaceae bacterium]|nr:peptidase M61 [Chitinophagales bacterium]